MKTDPSTLRSTYPGGRYRPITKSQAAEFKRRVIALMAETGAEPSYVSPDAHPFTEWHLTSPRFGPFHVTLYDQQRTAFSVYTRFTGDMTVVREHWGRFSGSPNTYSGKWNVLSNVAAAALADLRYQLETVGILSVP